MDMKNYVPVDSTETAYISLKSRKGVWAGDYNFKHNQHSYLRIDYEIDWELLARVFTA